ncbi:formate/nitrite transporter [Hathewaya proteolytica DSM 3090]|uniref:Formate/nitrite transporter n=1 Tax=Hathewaya proteolytica DSM 3090 TaxID=1121331 RepID=A0A1M6SLF6_9CLOT|nr:formate/nitrite transporter family protein [Hathewaya proteolytica]SHK45477.1 formate/nitrite transporter [Hathewaya proteolytica DSM 3090]
MENKMLKPKEIFDFTKNIGIEKGAKKFKENVTLSILAGMFIALGGFAAGVASHSIGNYGVAKLVSGVVFPVGLIMVLICGGELFTGNSLMSIAWLEKEISIKELLKNWIIVYLGNFIGSFFISLLLLYGGALDINKGAFAISVLKTAANKVNISFGQGVASGILCNILVCGAVWGSYAAKDIIGKIGMTVMPIMAFVIGGFEHCVANMYYLSFAFMAKGHMTLAQTASLPLDKLNNINAFGILGNLVPVTLGNIIGGAVVVAGLYWLAYNKRSNK